MTRVIATEDLSTTLPLSVLVSERHQHPDPSRASPRATGLWVGPFRGTRRGQGTDFDDLRDYVAGDEVRHIDWKVSARRGNLHTRLYREEKEHVMTFLADFRGPMFTGSKTLLSVTTGRLLAGLIWHAIDASSRVSLMVVTDEGIQSTRPASGHKSAIAACGLLASCFAVARTSSMSSTKSPAQSATKSSTKSPAQSATNSATQSATNMLNTALQELLALGRQVGTVVVASNFVDSGHDNFFATLNTLSQARPVVAIHMEDPLCYEGLPSGRYRYQSDSRGKPSPRVTQLRGSDRDKLLDYLATQRATLIEHFRTAKVSLVDGRISLSQVKAILHHQGLLS